MSQKIAAASNSAFTAALTEASTSRTVQAGRWKLHFNEAGSGDTVILLHGTGPGATGWTNFRPNIEPLAQHYRVIALDLPGWGGSDPIPPEDGPWLPVQVEAVKSLLDTLGIEKAALVGNSMGGMVGLSFATLYNERLSHLVTMGSGLVGLPSLLTPAGLPEGLRVIVETYRDPSVENFRRLLNIMVYDASFVTDDLLKARSDAALSNPQHLQNWLKGWLRPGPVPLAGDAIAPLMKIATPCLFIHGRDDRVVTLETSLRTLAVVPNSRLHVFNRCGHWTQIEHAKEFNALVHNFLQNA